ncbi:hypothetical protein M0R45_011861 [Rubus argutus]|uniref:F-box domain-containing protein n=1 Tax=Rubus argutus TaxID=59490 RepID=A0AAW1YF69_RUBAR
MEKKRRVFKLEEDRISELPDSVLCHILSFLPTLYAVRTTVLSTRWKSLWTCVSSLDFDQRDFPGFEGWLALGRFANCVLSLRDSSYITKFRLFCCSFGFRKEDLYLFDPWTFTPNWNDLFELDFCIVADHHRQKLEIKVSQRVFIYKTELILDLVSKCSITSGNYCFPSTLKSLNDLIRFLTLNYFPAVEQDMTIHGSFGKEPFYFPIFRYELMKMSTSFIIRDNEQPSYVLLNAPNLENLVIEGPAKDLPKYVLKDVHSLVKAEIDLPFADCLSPRGRLLLTGISSVESLSLSVPCDLVACTIPAFNNLKQLKLFHLSSLVWVTEFLKESPNLEFLVLDISHPKWRDAEYIEGFLNERYLQGFAPFNPPLVAPSCLLSHLKTILWSSFMGEKEEMNVVKYLFEYGQVLSKITISTYKHLSKEVSNKLCREILMFQKCSETCEVKVV